MNFINLIAGNSDMNDRKLKRHVERCYTHLKNNSRIASHEGSTTLSYRAHTEFEQDLQMRLTGLLLAMVETSYGTDLGEMELLEAWDKKFTFLSILLIAYSKPPEEREIFLQEMEASGIGVQSLRKLFWRPS